MGQAKRRQEALRRDLLAHTDDWSFAATPEEATVVATLLEMPAFAAHRYPVAELGALGMVANRCHDNARRAADDDVSERIQVVIGWRAHMLDLVLHSVVLVDGRYHCVTPSSDDEPVFGFIQDPEIRWVETPDGMAPFRGDYAIGKGVRRFPAFTIAINALLRERLAAGIPPHRASSFSYADMERLKIVSMTATEIATVKQGS